MKESVVGKRVVANGNYKWSIDLTGLKGTIIDYNEESGQPYTIEFDKNVNGHKGSYSRGKYGKDNHCLFLKESEFDIVETLKNGTRVKANAKYTWTVDIKKVEEEKVEKLKVGDKVRVEKCEDNRRIEGKIGTVLHIDGVSVSLEFTEDINGHGLGGKCKYGHGWYIDISKLKLIENLEKFEIEITTKGRKVTATRTENGKYISHAVATCHPDDTFDFEIGKNVALKRLFNFPEITNTLPTPEPVKRTTPTTKTVYKVGDTVKLVSKRPWTWVSDGQMDKFLGKTVMLTYVYGTTILFKGSEDWAFSIDDIECKVTSYPVYEVGDRVKIRTDLKSGTDCFYSVTCSMEDLAGKVFIITRRLDDVKYHINDDAGYNWHPSYFEGKVEDVPTTPSILTPAKRNKFEIGDRVKFNGYACLTNLEKGFKGTVIGFKDPNNVIVEYDNYIDGHDGHDDTGKIKGKDGHCWISSCGNLVHIGKVKEVSRCAKVGEYIKIVGASAVPTTNGLPDYKNGDILKVLEETNYMGQVRYSYEPSKDTMMKVVNKSEYVVLENYLPVEVKSEPEYPTEKVGYKFKIGDKVIHKGRVETVLSFGVDTLHTGYYVSYPQYSPSTGGKSDRPLSGKFELAYEHELKTPFNWEDFKDGKFAIKFDTKDEANAFLVKCESNGIRWDSGKKATEFEFVERFWTPTNYIFYSKCSCGLLYGNSMYSDRPIVNYKEVF